MSLRNNGISDLPGLRLWLQPSGIVYSGSIVTSWTDSSSSGFTLSEVAPNQPTLVPAGLNGYNGVKCTKASSQRLKRANAQLVTGAGNGVTVIMVVREDTTDGALQIWLSNQNAGITAGFEVGCSTGGKYDWLLPNAGATLSTSAVTNAAFKMVTIQQDGWSNATMRIDGVNDVLTNNLIPGTASPLTAGASGDLWIGARSNGTTHANVTLFEVIACEGKLSDAQVRDARSVLKTKYTSLA